MPLQVRPIAVGFAVMCFFLMCIVGALGGVSPSTCSKRALAGALVTYIGASLLIRAINAILTHAAIDNWVKQQEEQPGDK